MAVKDNAPSIPPIPGDITGAQRAFLQAVKDALTLRLGQTANQLDASPTRREILSGEFDGLTINVNGVSGSSGGGGGGSTPYNPFTDVTAPPAPTGLTAAAAGPNTILLNWNNPPTPNPSSPPYVAFTEVYGLQDVDDINSAVLLGVGYASFVHAVEPNTTWYYWVRFLNYAGIPGPFHPVLNGVTATSSQDATQYLDILTGEITESQLYATLQARIDQIDVTTVLGATGLLGAVAALEAADTSQQTDITALETSVNDPSTGLATKAASTTVTAIDTRLTALDGGVASGTSISQLETAVNDAVSDADAAVNTANATATDLVTTQAQVANHENGVFASATNISQIEANITAGDTANSAAIQTLANTTAGADGATAQYTIKVDANGHIAGFGLSSTSNTDTGDPGFTEAIFNVDRFSIVNSSGTGALVPFVVDGSQVVIDGAVIQDASINNAAIANLDAAKITTGLLSAQRISVDGSTISRSGNNLIIRALGVDTAQIANLAVETAKIANLNVTEGKIANLAVTTLKIADDAVTVPAGSYASSPGSVSGQTITWFDSVSLDSGGQPVFFTFTAYGRRSGNDANRSVGIRRNSSTIFSQVITLRDIDGRQMLTGSYYDSSPSSGTNTYWVGFAAGDSTDTFIIDNLTIAAIGMKK